MTRTNANADGRDPSVDDLDELFTVLADSRRRTAIEVLDQDGPLALEDLATRVAEREEALSPSDASVTLRHRHLPRLEEAGLVTYDAGERLCRWNGAPMVRAVLTAAREEVRQSDAIAREVPHR